MNNTHVEEHDHVSFCDICSAPLCDNPMCAEHWQDSPELDWDSEVHYRMNHSLRDTEFLNVQ